MPDAFTPDSIEPRPALSDADLATVAGHLHAAIQATAGSSGLVPVPGPPGATHTFGLGISDLLSAQDLIELRTMGTESLAALRDLGAKDLQVLTKVLLKAVQRKIGIPLFGG